MVIWTIQLIVQISEHTNTRTTGRGRRCSSCAAPVPVAAISAAHSLAGHCRRGWRVSSGRQPVCNGADGNGATGTNRNHLSRVVLQRFLAASWRDDQFHSNLQSYLDCLLVDTQA